MDEKRIDMRQHMGSLGWFLAGFIAILPIIYFFLTPHPVPAMVYIAALFVCLSLLIVLGFKIIKYAQHRSEKVSWFARKYAKSTDIDPNQKNTSYRQGDGENNSVMLIQGLQKQIKNSNSVLMGIISVLSKSDFKTRDRHFLRLMESSVHSLMNVVNDVFDYDQLKNGNLTLNQAPFDLHDALMQVADTSAIKASEKNLEFILDLDPNAPMLVFSDSIRITQIVESLCHIAIESLNQGEIILGVTSTDLLSKSCRLVFAVQMKMWNIDKNAAEVIKHYKNNRLTVNQNEWEKIRQNLLFIDSLCGRFEGALRIELNSQGELALVATIPVGLINEWRMGVARAKLHGMQVALISKSHAMSLMLTRLMEFWSVDVKCCSNVQDFLLAVNEQRVGEFSYVVLIDEAIGEEGIFEVKKIIQQSTSPTLANIVIMSSVVNPCSDEWLRKYGATALIIKPIKPVELISILGQALFSYHPRPRLSDVIDSPSSDSKSIQIRRGHRVLVVEDNQINQVLLESQLEELNIPCTLVANGQEALDVLSIDSGDRYSAILMDCLMPVMDGYEATKKIREGYAGSQYKNIPIIAMTGNVMDGDRERCIQSGMDDYLAKPIEESLLKPMLGKWIVAFSSLAEEKATPLFVSDKSVSVEPSHHHLSIWDETLIRTGDAYVLNDFYSAVENFDARFHELIDALKTAVTDQHAEQISIHLNAIHNILSSMGGVKVCRMIDSLHNEVNKGNWITVNQSLDKLAYECRLVRHFSARAMSMVS